jgi:hypothetical protein
MRGGIHKRATPNPEHAVMSVAPCGDSRLRPPQMEVARAVDETDLSP